VAFVEEDVLPRDLEKRPAEDSLNDA